MEPPCTADGSGGELLAQKRVRLDVDDPNTHHGWGVELAKDGRHEHAIEAFDRAIALDPDHAKSHAQRGAALAALQRYEDALAAYDRALELEADDAATLGALVADPEPPATTSGGRVSRRAADTEATTRGRA